MVPRLTYLTQAEMERENVDPPDELDLAKKMITNRRNFLQEHVVQDELQTRADSAAASKKKRAAAPAVGALVDNGTPSPSKKQKKEHVPAKEVVVKEKVRPIEGEQIQQYLDAVAYYRAASPPPGLPSRTKYQDRTGTSVSRRHEDDRRRPPTSA